MRIISKYRDYYDGVQAYGQDQTLVFVRKQEIIQAKDARDLEGLGAAYGLQDFDTNLTYSGFVVFFCGRQYPGIRIEVRAGWQMTDNITRYCYSTDECREFLVANKIPPRALFSERFYNGHYDDGYVNEFFNSRSRDELPLFQKHNCAVMASGYKGFYTFNLDPADTGYERYGHLSIKYPCLSKLEFFRVVDTNQAFQSIQSFLSGVLGISTPPMVAVSEKTRIAKRGFDKWSFRKLPTKKRKK